MFSIPDVHSLLSTPRHNAGRLPQPSTPSLQPSTPSSVTDPPLRQRTPRNPVATGNRVTVNNGGLYNTPDAGSATTSAGGTAINRTPANHNIPGRSPQSGVVTPSYVNGVVGGHPVTPSANQVTQRRVTSGVQVMRTLEEAGIISRYPPTPTIPRRPSGTGSATTPPVHVVQQDSAQFRTSRLLATLHPTPPGLGVHNAGPHTVVPGSQTPSTVAYAHTVTRHVNAQPTTPQVHGQTATARPHAYTAIPGAHAQTATRRPYVNTINPYGNDRTATPRPHAQTVTLGSQAHITPAINNQRPYTQQRLWTQRPQHNSDTYHTASVNPSITTRSPGRPVFGYATAINSGHANNGAPVTPAANLPRTPGYGSSGGLYISRNPAGNTPTPAYNARAYSMFIRDLNNQLFREYRKWEGKYEDFDDELEGDMELDVTEEEEGDDGAQVFRAVLKKRSGTIDQEDELLTLTGKGSSPPPQPIRDAIITPLLYQNNVATSFWCNNDVFLLRHVSIWLVMVMCWGNVHW